MEEIGAPLQKLNHQKFDMKKKTTTEGGNALVLAGLPKKVPLTPIPGDKCPYSIKKLKYHRGQEGIGFNLSLYYLGKHVGDVDDAAYGGDFDYHFFSHAAQDQFDAYLKALPIYDMWADGEYQPEDYHTTYAGTPVDRDAFINGLINEVEEQKELKKLRTHVVFVLHSKPRSVWSFKGIYSPAIKKELEAKYGADLKEIRNEKVS